MQATGSTNPVSGIGDYLKSIANEISESIMTNFQSKDILATMNEMEVGATSIAKHFGQGRENIVALQAAMGDAVVKVTEMGGAFSDVLQIQKDVATTLNRNLIVQKETLEGIYSASKVTGQSNETLIKGFKDAGFSLSHINKEMQNVVDVSRQQGVSAVAVSSKVMENMSALNKFGFENGVQGLAKMAAQATALRIDMKSTLDMADRLFDPEQAINMAASMQRLGVTQSDLLDPLRLMDLAQNDPAELQNQLSEMSKQFVQLNEKGQFEIMPGARRQLREIEKELQLPAGQLSKMALASAELDDKLSKISFPDFATEEQQKMIANMAEMGKGGQYEVTFTDKEGQTKTKAITELSKEDIDQLGEASQPKTLEDLAKEQLDTDKRIEKILESMANRTGRAFAGTQIVEQGRQASVEAYGAVAKTIGGGEMLQNEALRNALGGGTSELLKSLSQGDILGGLSNAFIKTGDYIQGAFNESLTNGKTALDNLEKSTNPVTQAFLKLGDSAVKFIAKNENLTGLTSPSTTTKVKDFVIPFEQDQLRVYNNAIVGGTNLGDNTNTNSSEEPKKISVDGNITVNVTSQGIDTNSLSMALNDLTVKQQIVQAVITGMNPNSNPNQLNQQIKSGELNSYNFG